MVCEYNLKIFFFLIYSNNYLIFLAFFIAECPVVTWLPSQTGSQSIVSVRWSHSRPTVFYALSDRSTVFVYDLLEQDNNAICTQTYEDRWIWLAFWIQSNEFIYFYKYGGFLFSFLPKRIGPLLNSNTWNSLPFWAGGVIWAGSFRRNSQSNANIALV